MTEPSDMHYEVVPTSPKARVAENELAQFSTRFLIMDFLSIKSPTKVGLFTSKQSRINNVKNKKHPHSNNKRLEQTARDDFIEKN